ncbi:unnamed protein product [Rhizoctonia solani]|uniref:Peptidase C14 caspase domain-containing protein n=1 Tax=Rhizoctonia solani TaxID=456999 RepID=A0A8H3B6X7_9AGAM|nr:unnamed protein product [Rhizoctonia solani]
MAPGLIHSLFILFFRLLCAPLPLVIKRRLKLNYSTPLCPILTITASTAGQLTPQEVILLPLYISLVLVAFTIARLYWFIYGHQTPGWTRSISQSVIDVQEDSVTKTKDHDVSDLARPRAGAHPTGRGPRKPAIQCDPVPTYIKEQLVVQSPTGEQTSQLPDKSSGHMAQDSSNRGRTEAVVKESNHAQTGLLHSTANANHQSALDPSTQPPNLNIRAKCKEVQKFSRSRGRAGGVCGAPIMRRTLDRDFRSPESRNTLLGSLKGFLTFKNVTPPSVPVHVLGVGLSWSHIQERKLPGAAHDIRWLEGFFAYQEQFYFTPLLDEDATFDAIYRQVEHIYSDAHSNAYIILYFTGHGNNKNAFELYGDHRSLDEVILNGWIVKLRKTTSKHIPVYIIFDFCRDNPDRSNVQLDDDITVIRSCPPGQKSPDIKLCDDLPYSCFLLALLLSICDGSEYYASSSMGPFSYRLRELFNTIWGIRCYKPGSWRRKRWCRHPESCGQCQDEKHKPCHGEWPDLQLFDALDNMYLGKLPDFRMVARYASTRFPLPIRKVRESVEGNKWFAYFNPIRIDTNKGSSTIKPRRLLPRHVHAISDNGMHTRGSSLPLEALSSPTALK